VWVQMRQVLVMRALPEKVVSCQWSVAGAIVSRFKFRVNEDDKLATAWTYFSSFESEGSQEESL